MANTLWGKVYFKDIYAGRLQEEPGGRCVFTYDNTYLEGQNPPIAYTLPLRKEPYISEQGLHPFFDNLVAEGWLKNAQARALGVDPHHRFALLLGFGQDLAGTVSVVDPTPREHNQFDDTDETTAAALLGRASLSGVQRKLLVVKDDNQYRPVRPNELSTHIAKLPSGNLAELLELEFLSMLAIQTLLPDDNVAEMELTTIAALQQQALIITRFDRTPNGKRRQHFEEFSQLLGRRSGDEKYEGSYEEMARFIRETPSCVSGEAERLFRRILACLLVGNTDAHFKNFAMFHTRDGLRLTPLYDVVAAAVYPDFQTIALSVGGIKNLSIGSLLPKHILRLTTGFALQEEMAIAAIENFDKHFSSALERIIQSEVGTKKLKKQLTTMMEKRWNGSFKSIGQLLSKKRSKGAKT